MGQGLIFLVPHLLVLRIMPETWGILPIILAGSLFLGWVRIRSASIVVIASASLCMVFVHRTMKSAPPRSRFCAAFDRIVAQLHPLAQVLQALDI